MNLENSADGLGAQVCHCSMIQHVNADGEPVTAWYVNPDSGTRAGLLISRAKPQGSRNCAKFTRPGNPILHRSELVGKTPAQSQRKTPRNHARGPSSLVRKVNGQPSRPFMRCSQGRVSLSIWLPHIPIRLPRAARSASPRHPFPPALYSL